LPKNSAFERSGFINGSYKFVKEELYEDDESPKYSASEDFKGSWGSRSIGEDQQGSGSVRERTVQTSVQEMFGIEKKNAR
jgi:hypothetical protein